MKLGLGLTGIVTVIMGLSGLWLTMNARDRLLENYRDFAIKINHVAEAGLENAMISRNAAEITSVLQAIDRRESLDRVMILDMRGTIRYSHDQADVGRTLPTDDPTCRVCHGHPLTDRPATVILPSQAGGRTLRVARPLFNRPRCQGCHHERVLGMLITDFSLAEADRQIKSLLASLLLGILITLVGVVGATIGFVYLAVARPLTAFLKVTQSIGEGDVNQRVALVRRDEIGELAASFNRMMERLAAGAREIRRLNAELEDRVRQRTAQLEASNQELGAFSYSISHDLRAPLRAIDGFSQMLLRSYHQKLDDEGKRLLGVIRSNTLRMAQLIDDLLSLSRVGRQEIRRSRLDMGDLVEKLFQKLIAQDPTPPAELRLEPLPPAYGDPALVRQVLTNLLSNALKFSSKRERRIVEVGSHLEGGETVFFVKDNGAGFDMKYADKLFGVFQRLHGQTEFSGTGVGLAIVERIIKRFDGRVWARGESGVGATFFFTLPSTGDRP